MFSNNNFQFLNTCTKRALRFSKCFCFVVEVVVTVENIIKKKRRRRRQKCEFSSGSFGVVVDRLKRNAFLKGSILRRIHIIPKILGGLRAKFKNIGHHVKVNINLL